MFRTTVQDVMTTDVATIRPEATLKDAARTLAQRRISGLPVVDDHGRLVGVISEADVLAKEERAPDQPGALRRLARRGDRGQDKHAALRVAEAMTSPAITVGAYWSIASTAQRMLEHQVNRLPVVRQGELVGIVTRADLVRAFARTDDEIEREIHEQLQLQQSLFGSDDGISVVVDDGEVLLTGAVRYRSEADLLPRVVAVVPGVAAVKSEVTWAEER